MEPSIQEMILRFKASGEISRMAFCKRHGVSYHKFKYHWKRQQQEAPAGSGFICLKPHSPLSKIKPVEIVKETIVARFFSGGQVTLEVQGEFSAHFLRELAGC